MFTRVLGIKIATAVLATSLAVGGVVAGVRTGAPPSVTAPAAVATRPAQVEVASTAVPGATPRPASTAATSPSQVATSEPSAQPAPTSTAVESRPPLAGLFPFLRPNPPRNGGNVGNVGGAGGSQAPKTAVTGHSVGGLVLSVTGNRVLLRRQNGSGDAQVTVRPATVIREQGKDVPIGNVHPGDRIIVIGVPERDGSLAAQAMVVYPRARPAARNTPRPRLQSQ